MERDEAVRKLKQLEGQNLHCLAKKYGLVVSTTWKLGYTRCKVSWQLVAVYPEKPLASIFTRG